MKKTECLGTERNIRSCPPIFTPSFVFIERNEPADKVDVLLQVEIFIIREIFKMSVITLCRLVSTFEDNFSCHTTTTTTTTTTHSFISIQP